MNLPIELVDKILQYDGRMKYRKGEFVNLIHPINLGFYSRFYFSFYFLSSCFTLF